MKKVVQDDSREKMLCELFKLTATNSNRIGTDCILFDINDAKIELKTTTKNSISTARDVGFHTIQKWRELYWICAKGNNEEKGYHIEKIFFLHPLDLEEWFKKIENDLQNKKNIIKDVLDILKKEKFRQYLETEKLLHRGNLKNDPNIPWSYIEKFGTKIETNHAEKLRYLIKKRPIISNYVSEINTLIAFCS